MPSYNVGIVGAGIAGLYTALLLQREGHSVHIFEATNRIGGRVYTHYFTAAENQYYEAGAMRIPDIESHGVVFSLIKYLNGHKNVPARMDIRLIDYVYRHENNDMYFNSSTVQGEVMTLTPLTAGWISVPESYKTKNAGELLDEAFCGLSHGENDSFDRAISRIVREYDHCTFRHFLISVKHWPPSVIDFVEATVFQPNEFSLSVPEIYMRLQEFKAGKWKTINQGMSRLPEAMAWLVGYQNITIGAQVTQVITLNDKRIRIKAVGHDGIIDAEFDRLILAIPPAALQRIANRPTWSLEKETAIRSLQLEPLYKMGLRFKTRFWEDVSCGGNFGGQTNTDLPIRWLVFPSHGIGESEPGVLLVYGWMTDAANWFPLDPIQRRALALECIAKMFQGKRDRTGAEINVHELLIESSDTIWSEQTATGATMFRPGQLTRHFAEASRPEGNIFFAGEHLSYHHTWIAGAIHSGIQAARDLLDINVQPLDPGLLSENQKGIDVKDIAKAKFKLNPNALLNLSFRKNISECNCPEGSSELIASKGHQSALGPIVTNLEA
ncbi:L-amino-acid oxidase [Fusarium fujikuroi]|nr:L-amino-acid oxidase [Fusarium fujikuroi]